MKKRIFLSVIILLIALCVFASGCKTNEENTHKGEIVIEIRTVEEFLNIKNQLGADYDKATFKLIENLDFSSVSEYEAIGKDYVNSFRSVFDGNNKKISNLTVTKGYEYFGLFGYTVNAAIKDLTIENLTVALPVGAKDVFIGGVAAHSSEKLQINNVKVESYIDVTMDYKTIEGENDIRYEYGDNQYIGGVVGYGIGEIIIKNTESKIILDNQHDEESAEELNKPKVYIKNLFAGGLCGYLRGITENGLIENSNAEAEMMLYADKSAVGGFIGYADNISLKNVSATVKDKMALNSYVRTNVGGLLGVASNVELEQGETDIANIILKQNFANIGGLIGYADKATDVKDVTVKVNYSINDTMKSISLGGVIGNMIDSNLINVNAVTGKILSSNNELDYSKESIAETRYIGGLIGKMTGKSILKEAKTELKAYQGAIGISIVKTIPESEENPEEIFTPVVENATVFFLKENCLAKDTLSGSRIKNNFGTELEEFLPNAD